MPPGPAAGRESRAQGPARYYSLGLMRLAPRSSLLMGTGCA